ncbi:hypothetical protein M768_13990 [Cellulosimicrobium cellulans F16]|uniref:Uncharacterized protein n=1 Tax=Cellulosimicrobium cellulans F16 TaxID=1350482 RepID=A0A0M0F4V5_CELCE|nr:hypothetical protein [Cellulosimicrobium cellulans]KON72614.1 hypothetical protein M768_13990 [Cellulosimicrobium cellulans F16]
MSITPEWPQGVGTVLTVLGLLAVAPQASGAAIASLPLWLLRQLARIWPALRRPVVHRGGGTVSVALQFRGDVRGKTPWVPDAPVTEQLQQLRDAVDSLERLHDEMVKRVNEVEGTLREKISAELARVEQRVSELEERIRRAEREAHEIQTGGFAPAALGALLAGVPEWFSDRPALTIAALVLGALSLCRVRWALWQTVQSFATAFPREGFFRPRAA